MLTPKAQRILTTAQPISIRRWLVRRTHCPVGVRRVYVSISNEGIVDGETAVLNIAALNVGRKVTGEETASCEVLRIDPGNPEVEEEEGNRSETPTRQLRSRLILGEDRTDPITVNHYYVIYAAIVKTFKT